MSFQTHCAHKWPVLCHGHSLAHALGHITEQCTEQNGTMCKTLFRVVNRRLEGGGNFLRKSRLDLAEEWRKRVEICGLATLCSLFFHIFVFFPTLITVKIFDKKNYRRSKKKTPQWAIQKKREFIVLSCSQTVCVLPEVQKVLQHKKKRGKTSRGTQTGNFFTRVSSILPNDLLTKKKDACFPPGFWAFSFTRGTAEILR